MIGPTDKTEVKQMRRAAKVVVTALVDTRLQRVVQRHDVRKAIESEGIDLLGNIVQNAIFGDGGPKYASEPGLSTIAYKVWQQRAKSRREPSTGENSTPHTDGEEILRWQTGGLSPHDAKEVTSGNFEGVSDAGLQRCVRINPEVRANIQRLKCQANERAKKQLRESGGEQPLVRPTPNYYYLNPVPGPTRLETLT